MADFKLIDTNRYALPGTSNRFLHLATVHYGLKEYMCLADRQTNQVYIEEITGGRLSFISDDSLAQAIADFLAEKGITSISKPLLEDRDWLKKR